MQTKLEVICDPDQWTKLSVVEKTKLKLKASIDPVAFWEDERMGNVKLWDSQKEILRKFNEKTPYEKRKYKELLFAAGMRSSKTTVGALLLLTEFKECLNMNSPQQKFGLLENQEITFLCTASTEKQCHRTIFKRIVGFIENSPFFASFAKDANFNYTTGKIEFPKNLTILGLGSNLKANVGLTVKVFVAEEINFTGEESYKVSPKNLYNKLSRSTMTFKPFNEDVKIAISSMADGSDFLSQRIELTRKQKLDAEQGGTTMILQKTSFEMNPNLKKEHMQDEILMDEEDAAVDFGEGDRRTGNKFFKKYTLDKVKKHWDRNNVFKTEPSYGESATFIPDLDIDSLEYDKNAVSYGLFGDPASVGDAFGFTVAHLRNDDVIIIDGATVFKAAKGEEIDPKIIKHMVYKIINKVPVEFYQYDIYMYNELRKELSNVGIEPIQHILRINDWEALKERMNTSRIFGPYFNYLERELVGLRIHNGKVAKPANGSKDLIDSICQTVAHWDADKDSITNYGKNKFVMIQGMK